MRSVDSSASKLLFSAATSGLSARELYLDASAAKFSESEEGRKLFQSLKQRVLKLESAAAASLLGALVETAKGRNGAAALEEEIATAKASCWIRLHL